MPSSKQRMTSLIFVISFGWSSVEASNSIFFQGQANASVAEKTLQCCGDNTTWVSFDSKGTATKPECFGCVGPYPWSKLTNGKYTIICPNANEPGVREKAELNIWKYQAWRKKNARSNKKHHNLNTVNWEDIPKKQHEAIAAQQRALLSVGFQSIASSASSTLRGGSSSSITCHTNVTLHQDVVILSTQSLKPQIPIAIHSHMPHLSLQMGTFKEEKDCTALRCMIDTDASLNTANFH